jgi:hypothetical protein
MWTTSIKNIYFKIFIVKIFTYKHTHKYHMI